MADIDSVADRKQRLRSTFEELEKERQILSRFVIQWKELDEFFADAERDVQSRYADLAAREKAFQDKQKELLDALSTREAAVQRKEEELERRRLEAIQFEKSEAVNESMDSGEDTQPQLEGKDEEHHARHEEHLNASSMDLDLNVQPTASDPAEDEETVAAKPAEVSVRPEIKAFCENMDADGLRRFIVEHRKEVANFRHELPPALLCAADPARMVVTALEAYHSDGQSGRKETEASVSRRACILLLESLHVVMSVKSHPVVVSPDVKEEVKQIAEKWRSKMDSSQKDALDAQAFLQLLVTFDITSEYDPDELCRLITDIARRKQTPALCRALGLTEKIPDIVDKLVEEGKQIEALSFASEFGIMDRIDPVSLLKDYLKEARKIAQTMLKTGHSSAAAQNDSMMKELSALRSVIKCIEEYKLESEYPSSPLQKRISHLEKAKLDRKRTGGSVKGQSKRPRGSNNGGYSYRNSDSYRTSDRNPDRNQYVSSAGYQFVSPVAFDRQNQGGYITSYAPGSRNTVSLSTIPPSSYLYTADTMYGPPGFSPTPSTSYPSYGSIRGSLPPPPPAYQASFMH